jgi:hypothetical protein
MSLERFEGNEKRFFFLVLKHKRRDWLKDVCGDDTTTFRSVVDEYGVSMWAELKASSGKSKTASHERDNYASHRAALEQGISSRSAQIPTIQGRRSTME